MHDSSAPGVPPARQHTSWSAQHPPEGHIIPLISYLSLLTERLTLQVCLCHTLNLIQMTPSKQQAWHARGGIACPLHIQSGDAVLTPPHSDPHLLVSVSADLQRRSDFADRYRNQQRASPAPYLSPMESEFIVLFEKRQYFNGAYI